MTDLVGWLLEPSHHTPETEQQRQKRILYELLCDLKGGLFENLTNPDYGTGHRHAGNGTQTPY